MKITQVLYKQHIGRHITKLWYIKRERKLEDDKLSEYLLKKFKIQTKDALDVAFTKTRLPKVKVETIKERILPSWNSQSCLVFNDNNVLQEGFCQAQILTNTVCLMDSSLNYIQDSVDLPKYVDGIVRRIIFTSNIFDAHQEKLSIRKDSERPAWVFPRDYGITNCRKMRNLSRKILQLCESLSGPDIAKERCILYDGHTKLNLEKESDIIQFRLKSDIMVMSAKPVKPLRNSIFDVDIDLPNIYPMHHTISLNKTNFFETEDRYPVSATTPWKNVHTIFVHYDPVKVKNLTELPVTESQIIGRALIKSYTMAAFCARQKFGSSVKALPEPVTLQCIHSDGKNYHFFIFQLNSLDANDISVKNFWYALPPLTLYQTAEYINAKPILTGYNSEVFRRILAFYKNGN